MRTPYRSPRTARPRKACVLRIGHFTKQTENYMGTTLRQALHHPDGSPRFITRFEIEVLGGGKCRWILWDGRQRIYMTVIDPSEYFEIMDCTRILLDGMAGIPPTRPRQRRSRRKRRRR